MTGKPSQRSKFITEGEDMQRFGQLEESKEDSLSVRLEAQKWGWKGE